MEGQNDNFVTLIDDEGKELKFEHLDTLEFDDRTYVVCVPADVPDDEIEEVMIFEASTDENGEECLIQLEDEEILESVYQLFKENNTDIFDFED